MSRDNEEELKGKAAARLSDLEKVIPNPISQDKI